MENHKKKIRHPRKVSVGDLVNNLSIQDVRETWVPDKNVSGMTISYLSTVSFRSGFLKSLLLALSVLVGACSSASQSLRPALGTELVFRVERPQNGGLEAMAEALRGRLAARQLAGSSVKSDGAGRIRVRVPGLTETESADLARALVLAPGFSLCLVDEGVMFFQALTDKLPGDGSVRVAVETHFVDGKGDARDTAYLMANRREVLEKFLVGIQAPPGRSLKLLPGEWGVLAYLLVDPPASDRPRVKDAQVVRDDPSGAVAVTLQFDEAYRVVLAELTQKHLHRRLAILVDDEIRSLPFIQTPITGGRARILASPLAPVAVAEREAQALAAGLKAWSLAGSLRLVDDKAAID